MPLKHQRSGKHKGQHDLLAKTKYNMDKSNDSVTENFGEWFGIQTKISYYLNQFTKIIRF